jgi:hypothetical protein
VAKFALATTRFASVTRRRHSAAITSAIPMRAYLRGTHLMLFSPVWQMAPDPQTTPAETHSFGFCSGDTARIKMSSNFLTGSGRGKRTRTGA